VHGHDEGGGKPFSSSPRLLPAVESLVGSQLRVAPHGRLLKGRSSRAPGGHEWRQRAAVTSTLWRVVVCGGGDSFSGVRALCAGVFAASMAAVRHAWAGTMGHLGGGERCGEFWWQLPRQKACGIVSISFNGVRRLSRSLWLWSW
jgi:hypothetical protein